MTGSSPAPPTNTFVVRFWHEWSTAGPRWRGRVEHLQSGQSVAFQDLERMLAFMRSIGLVADNQRPREEQECVEETLYKDIRRIK